MKRHLILAAALATGVALAGPVMAADSTVRVTQDGDADWHIGRDLSNVSPSDFTLDEARIGFGSLSAGPLGAVPANKFIAELYDVDTHLMSMPVQGLQSIGYSFLQATGGPSDYQQFYLNVYVNVPDSDTFYDCAYDYVPTSGALGEWVDVTVDPTATPTRKRTRGVNAAQCKPTLAEMGDSKITFLSLNMGDAGANVNDAGLAGYFDRVQIVTGEGTTTYDFEPQKDDCKAGGWISAVAGFKNQGDCVSALAK